MQALPLRGLEHCDEALTDQVMRGRRSRLESGEIALLYSRWTTTTVGPDGQRIEMSGEANEVARRQAEGTWLLVIDNPYGRRGVEGGR